MGKSSKESKDSRRTSSPEPALSLRPCFSRSGGAPEGASELQPQWRRALGGETRGGRSEIRGIEDLLGLGGGGSAAQRLRAVRDDLSGRLEPRPASSARRAGSPGAKRGWGTPGKLEVVGTPKRKATPQRLFPACSDTTLSERYCAGTKHHSPRVRRGLGRKPRSYRRELPAGEEGGLGAMPPHGHLWLIMCCAMA